MVSYAMNSYHQFQELIKAGVGSEEVSSRICCADHVALYVVLLMLCYINSVSTLYPIMVVHAVNVCWRESIWYTTD